MSQTTLADTPDQPTALTNFTPTEGDDNELQKLDVGKDDIESNPSGPSTVAENKVIRFPLKLHRLLSDTQDHDIVSWKEDSVGFRILDEKRFPVTQNPTTSTRQLRAKPSRPKQSGFTDVGKDRIGGASGGDVRTINDVQSKIPPAGGKKRSRRRRGDDGGVKPVGSSVTPPAEDLGDNVSFDTVEPFDTRGHFCDLFLGTHRTAGKVALKRLRNRGGNGEDLEIMARQFKRENDVWMGLQHDWILRCLGMFMRERHLYLVSPFMKNGSLFDWLRHGEPPGLDRLRLIHELAGALVYLHSRGIVHGDVKANNVLLSDDIHVQLCDFGLAKLAGSATSTTLKGAGTVRWQSPELFFDNPKSFKSDVYAFAMTIVEVLTGKIPFSTISSDYAVILAVSQRGERPGQSPAPAPDGKSYQNPWLVAGRCWNGDPDQRISMTEAVELFSLCTERY